MSDCFGGLADKPEEACAVFGVYAPGLDASRLTYFGLHALQHRGQESAGIAVADGSSVLVTKEMGLVTQVFNENSLAALTGHVAIGHARYSTSGGFSSWDAAQPHLSAIGEQIIALAHNGTLVNTNALRARLLDLGISFRSNTDSEVAAKLIGYFTQETHHMREGIRKTMELIEGAYAMTLITHEALYAFRDPNGIRPLSIGRLPEDKGWVVSSETCGLDIVGASFVRDVQPGEVIRINGTGEGGLACEQAVSARKRALCIFEYVYFARPDSELDGIPVQEARLRMGAALARESPADADAVIGVPDSGLGAAMGYAAASGIPCVMGLVKNKYIGRTFIAPTQDAREKMVFVKHTALKSDVAGKRVIVIDDSIVRGTTCKRLVQVLRRAGAREVHFRVSSPPVRYPCHFGIDTPCRAELISAARSEAEIREEIGADSLAFISIDGMFDALRSISPETYGYCKGCFTGEYPIPFPGEMNGKRL